MNRILQRIAAYYNDNSTINNTIELKDSNDKYFRIIKPQKFLNRISDGNDLIDELEYEENKIGLCGDTFVSKRGNNVTIEWHVREITSESITNVYKKLTKQYEDGTITSMVMYDKIHQELDQYIKDHYFIGVLLVFINNNYDSEQSSGALSFKQDTSTIELVDYGKKIIKSKKIQLMNNNGKKH